MKALDDARRLIAAQPDPGVVTEVLGELVHAVETLQRILDFTLPRPGPLLRASGTGDWSTCVACGSEEIAHRALTVTEDGALLWVAWCPGATCEIDRAQTVAHYPPAYNRGDRP